MRSIYSGIRFDEPLFKGLSVRSAIDRHYKVGEPEIEAFEALPIPRVPVDEALKLSLKLYAGEEAVIVQPAPYSFREPLVKEAKYVVLDGRRVNRQDSSRLKYLKEFSKRKITGILGAPKWAIEGLLLSGADFVIELREFEEFEGRKAEIHRLAYEKHEEARKAFVLRAEEEPLNLRFLRLLDRDSVYHGEIIKGSLTSLERPEVSWRLRRMLSYEPPEGDVLILLPCSAKKPYSLSKTHKPIVEITKKYRVHELIITSPLIVVPRELETVFPAMSYDHPPTGKRTYGEKGAVAKILKELLRKYESLGYKHVIAFLPKDYREALELLDRPMDVYEGKRLDPKRLKRKLEELKASGELRDGSRDRSGMAKNALSFLYSLEPPEGLERFVDRIALRGETFGVWRHGVLKPKKRMLERLENNGLFIEAPTERIQDIRELDGDAQAGLYVARKRKGLRSLRLALHMWQIRKLLEAGVDGIYSLERL